MTTTISPEMHEVLREFLKGRGYQFEQRPHQIFLAKGNQTVVNLYSNGKVVLGGSGADEREAVLRFIESIGGQPESADLSATTATPSLDFHETRVGMDEAGKGDYFGPLVAAAVLATEFQAKRMRTKGIRDSKELKDPVIQELASWLRKDALAQGQWRLVSIPPARYNLLILRMGNLNRLLGWAHARALEDVLKFNEPCELAIADQFGDPSYIEDALMANGRQVRLVQTPKGERDVVVAAASILARDGFISAMKTMNQRFGESFPLGASNVEVFAKRLVERHGVGILLDTAKIHFATTARVVKSIDTLTDILTERDTADKARAPTSRNSPPFSR